MNFFLPSSHALPYNPANTTDFQTPGQYVVGTNADDNSPWLGVTARNLSGGDHTANQPYLLGFGYAPSGAVTAVAMTNASTGVFENFTVVGQGTTTVVTGAWSTAIIGVAHTAVTNNTVGIYVIKGFHDCLVDGTTDVAIGDTVRLAATKPTALIKDVAAASWQNTNPPPMAVAVANQASTADSANKTRVNLIGKTAFIAAT